MAKADKAQVGGRQLKMRADKAQEAGGRQLVRDVKLLEEGQPTPQNRRGEGPEGESKPDLAKTDPRRDQTTPGRRRGSPTHGSHSEAQATPKRGVLRRVK